MQQAILANQQAQQKPPQIIQQVQQQIPYQYSNQQSNDTLKQFQESERKIFQPLIQQNINKNKILVQDPQIKGGSQMEQAINAQQANDQMQIVTDKKQLYPSNSDDDDDDGVLDFLDPYAQDIPQDNQLLQLGDDQGQSNLFDQFFVQPQQLQQNVFEFDEFNDFQDLQTQNQQREAIQFNRLNQLSDSGFIYDQRSPLRVPEQQNIQNQLIQEIPAQMMKGTYGDHVLDQGWIDKRNQNVIPLPNAIGQQLFTQDLVYNNKTLWNGVMGTHAYYGIAEGHVENEMLSSNAVGPLLTEVFIPGRARYAKGPRLNYTLDQSAEGQPIQIMQGIKFKMPELEDPISAGTNVIEAELIKLIRLKIKLPDIKQRESLQDFISQIIHRAQQSMSNLVQQEQFSQFRILRFFFHFQQIGETSDQTIENVQQQAEPICMNFQTILKANQLNTVQQQIYAACFHLEKELTEKMLLDYYYVMIYNIRLRFVNVYLLFQKINYTKAEQSKYLFEKHEGKQGYTSESVWKDLDLTTIREDFKGFSCLEKIILFALDHEYKQHSCLAITQLQRTWKQLKKSAQEGKSLEVFLKVQQIFAKQNIDVFLYIEGMHTWLNEISPQKDQKCYVVVLRKGHALICKNQELQKALNSHRESYTMTVPKKKQQQILKFVFDIETYTLDTRQIPYCICVILEGGTKSVFWGDKCVNQFLCYVQRQIKFNKRKRLEFWSFNGSRFDNLLLISEMLNITNDTQVFGTNTQIKILLFFDVYFFDMCLIYPGSLVNVAKQLECQNQVKKGIDVKGKSRLYYEQNKQEIIEYCYHDCIILFEIVNKHYFFKKYWNIESIQIGTNSSLSIQIFLNNFYQSKTQRLKGSKTINQYLMEKASYHGGFTMNTHRGEQEGPFYYYDLNSSYPNQMQGWIPMDEDGQCDYKESDEIVDYFLYDVEGCWKEEVLLPTFCEPVRIDANRANSHTLLYFRKFSRQFRWGAELSYPKRHNLFENFKIYRVYRYKKKKPFKTFVQELYKQRLEYKRQGKLDMAQATKLCLNSLYGKMGQKQHAEVIWCKVSDLVQYVEREDLASLSEVDEENGIFRVEFEKHVTLDWIGSLVNKASYITAKARNQLFMMFHILGFQNIIYSDTDSLISKVKMPEQFISQEELGKWKLEHTVDHVTVWGPKFYRLRVTHDQTKSTIQHIKGVKDTNYYKKDLTPEQNIARANLIWQTLKDTGKVDIVNEDVFVKQFGVVYVEVQDKKISIKMPTRDFYNVGLGWESSRPFKDYQEYQEFTDLYCLETKLVTDPSIFDRKTNDNSRMDIEQ